MATATKYFVALSVAVCLLSVALGSVSFDPATGTGFVGKGDVQLVFGWSNAQLQTQVKAKAVSFIYDRKDTYDVECEWETVTGGPRSKTILHDITVPKHVQVKAEVAVDPRVKNQVTGFNLDGFGETNIIGTVPVAGGNCPNNNPGTITEVIQTGTTSGLFVVWKGEKKELVPSTTTTTTP